MNIVGHGVGVVVRIRRISLILHEIICVSTQTHIGRIDRHRISACIKDSDRAAKAVASRCVAIRARGAIGSGFLHFHLGDRPCVAVAGIGFRKVELGINGDVFNDKILSRFQRDIAARSCAAVGTAVSARIGLLRVIIGGAVCACRTKDIGIFDAEREIGVGK